MRHMQVRGFKRNNLKVARVGFGSPTLKGQCHVILILLKVKDVFASVEIPK